MDWGSSGWHLEPIHGWRHSCVFANLHRRYGNFRAQYHVSNRHDVWYGDMRMSPYYSDQNLDQVTYGGPWCLKRMDSTKPVYIYHPHTDRLSKSRIHQYKKLGGNRWAAICTTYITRKGESGSPIYQMIQDRWVVVGFNGKNMTSAADMYTDLVWETGSAEDPLWNEEYHEMVLKRGIVRELILHPGGT